MRLPFFRYRTAQALAILVGAMVSATMAQETVPLTPEQVAKRRDAEGLPQEVASGHFEMLMGNSPFTRSL
ncbi:MAG: hypothetical protein KDM63_15630, partial [Verrucomicrobiae bacterium]|nr:hypothetical protein [Verrucomicrobiae bacterium]